MTNPFRFLFPAGLFSALAFISGLTASAQTWDVKGTVYDISQNNPVDGVTVLTTSGRGTMTDSLGRYKITVNMYDSVFFPTRIK